MKILKTGLRGLERSELPWEWTITALSVLRVELLVFQVSMERWKMVLLYSTLFVYLKSNRFKL